MLPRQEVVDRRQFLSRSGMGFGMLGFAGAVANEVAAAEAGGNVDRLNGRSSHHVARAKHVIHIFANGGPSHVDTFDPKPMLEKRHGQVLPTPNLLTEFPTGAVFASPFRFTPYGESGLEISELFAHVGRHADDLCVIRSMVSELPNHEPSLMLMNCGDTTLTRPSLGSWLTYGLGSVNENLPAFVALCPKGLPIKGTENWRSAFLPGGYSGTWIDTQHQEVEKLIENIRNPRINYARQRRQVDLLQKLNRQHLDQRGFDPQLQARIQSYEQGFRMQMEAAEAFDVDHEPESIRAMYGDSVQARQILMARRLVERGVRFVQVWHGSGQPWDNHRKIEENHRKLAGETSMAIGALLSDLKQRGLLDETLVIWGGEFGRTPTVELHGDEKTLGRDHNHYGFSMWLAGGGVKGGVAHGATDEFGFEAVENRVTVHDLHATILHLLGLDHQKLTYRYAGRDFRLTDVYGRVVDEIVA